MRFVLTTVDKVGTVADHLLDTSADTTVGELAQALGTGRTPTLFVAGAPVDPQLNLRDSPLRQGVVVGLDRPVSAVWVEPRGVAEIRYVGGYDAGMVIRLDIGDYLIGAASTCRIRIAEEGGPPARARLRVLPDGCSELIPLTDNGLRLDRVDVTEPRPWHDGTVLAVGSSLLELSRPQPPDAALAPSEDRTGLDYNRPPRLLPAPRFTKFTLPSPPQPPERRPLSFIAAAAPYTYDAFGRIATIANPLGDVTRVSWARNGEVAEIVEPDGSAQRWTFDGEGNLRESVGAQGQVTRTEIAYFDLPVAEIAPETGRTEFTYDTESRLTSVTNARGQVWRYEYNAAGSLVREIDFDNRELRYKVDAAGRMVERTNASGQTLQLTWDEQGRLVRIGATTYFYDAAGRLIRAVGPHADLEMRYDAVGRVLSETVNGRTMVNGYDRVGRRVHRRTPSGAESGWKYNDAGQPTALHVAGRVIKFGYDVAGREIGRSVGRVRVAQTWDSGNRLNSQMVFNGSPSAVQSKRYSYREDGTLIAVDDLRRGVRVYEVDGPGRVTAVIGQHWTERYSYDEAGALVCDTKNRDYDADGRLVQRRDGERVWRYKWDALDRMIAVITPERDHLAVPLRWAGQADRQAARHHGRRRDHRTGRVRLGRR